MYYMLDTNDKPLSQAEAYRVTAWLRKNGKSVDAALVDIWKKRPTEVASEYRVKPESVVKAAGRELVVELEGE